MDGVVIAYSGGLDSTCLLHAALAALGRGKVLAVTARSETYPAAEYREARGIARRLGARHLTIATRELALPGFRKNPVNRCYFCKKELFKRLDVIRRREGLRFILDGTNADDLKDIRHGRQAATELGVRSPLLEAGIGKAAIRSYSKRMRLPTWNKPPFACLASRFPFHSTITRAGLERVGRAEDALRRLGFRQLRVRSHGSIARIELLPGDFARFIRLRPQAVAIVKRLGFVYVSLDLEGYRTGSMHEAV